MDSTNPSLRSRAKGSPIRPDGIGAIESLDERSVIGHHERFRYRSSCPPPLFGLVRTPSLRRACRRMQRTHSACPAPGGGRAGNYLARACGELVEASSDLSKESGLLCSRQVRLPSSYVILATSAHCSNGISPHTLAYTPLRETPRGWGPGLCLNRRGSGTEWNKIERVTRASSPSGTSSLFAPAAAKIQESAEHSRTA